MIRNNDDLIEAIINVGFQLQEIQNYIGPIIKDKNIQTNLSYALQLSDLHCWLLNRLNLWSIVKQMVIKNGIILMASISESISVYSVKDIQFGLRNGFDKRIAKMEKEEMISPELRNNLLWLWEMRANIHIYEIKHTEYEKYSENDYIKAVDATRRFVFELNSFFSR